MLINWSKDTHDEEGGGCVLSNLVSCSRVGTFNHQLDCLAPGKCLRNGYCCHVVFLSKAVSLWRARTWFRGLMTNFLEAETKVSRDYEADANVPQWLHRLHPVSGIWQLFKLYSPLCPKRQGQQLKSVPRLATRPLQTEIMTCLGSCGNETAQEPESSGPNSEILMLLHAFQNSTRRSKSQGGREMQRKDFASGGCSSAC